MLRHAMDTTTRVRLAELLAAGLVLVSVWLIGSRDVAGQWLMLAAQGLWLVVAVTKGMNGLAVQSVVLAGMTVRAIAEWGGL